MKRTREQLLQAKDQIEKDTEKEFKASYGEMSLRLLSQQHIIKSLSGYIDELEAQTESDAKLIASLQNSSTEEATVSMDVINLSE